MFDWFLSRFRQPKPARLAVFGFTEKDGTRRHLDPAHLRRTLADLDPHWMDKVRQLQAAGRPLPEGTDPQVQADRLEAADLAAKELAGLVSQAFGVAPLSPAGEGWTEAERVALLASYLLYCAELKEAHRPL